jgi:hypothetical protein
MSFWIESLLAKVSKYLTSRQHFAPDKYVIFAYTGWLASKYYYSLSA